MANVVVLGLCGSEGLWVADLDAGTIIPMEEAPTGELANAASLRKIGDGFVKGVNFAVSVSTDAETASGFFEASTDTNKIAGGFFEASADINNVAGGFFEADSAHK